MPVPIPVLGLSLGTYIEDDHGVLTDRTDDGAVLQRETYAQTYYDIRAVYNGLAQAEHRALRQFVRDYRSAEVSVTVDGEQYVVRIIGGLRTTWSHGGSFADCALQLRGLRV